MRRILSTAALFLLLILIGSPGWSEVERVEMRVDGLACPFCAYGLEKKLKDVEGVSEIEIRVDEGRVVLKAAKDGSIDVDRLKPAVEDAGFTAREMTATAVGSLETTNDRPVLQVSGSDTEFILEESSTLRALQAELEGSNRARITGRLSKETPEGHRAHPFTMMVETFEILASSTE